MKRLIVRLSVVGAVLALGGAAIAYRVLSKPGDAPAADGEQIVAAAQSPALPPAPIRAEKEPASEPPRALQPPPSSAFEHANTLRTVSHETDPARADVGDSEDGTESADLIPTADPTDATAGYNTNFPVAAPSYGAEAEDGSATRSGSTFPAPATGTSAGDDSYGSASGLPAAPTYGADYAIGSAGDRVSPGNPSEASGGPLPPNAGIPPGSVTGGGTNPSGGTSRLGAPSFDSPADEPVTRTSPPAPTAGLGNTARGAGSAERSLADQEPDANAMVTRQPSAASSAGAQRLDSSGAPANVLAAGAAIGATAAGLANSRPGATSNPAVNAERSTFTPDSPLAGVSAPPPASYPTTDATGTTAAGARTSAQPVAPPQDNASLSATGGYAAATTAPDYSAAGSAATSSAPYGAGGGETLAASDAGSPILLASDLPGDRQLEGQQTPAILIEKMAPEEIQVDRQATFQVRVRNAGNAVAHNVVVVDRVPRGTQFVDAVPPVTPTADGTLAWQLATVKPGEEIVLSINLMPKVAGEIGSVAQATFQAQASVRAICTKPELKLDVTFPSEILIGQPATLDITVTNTGNGAAEKVVIEEDVPEGFAHAAGRQLEQEIGTLRPQESRRLTLILDTTQPGSYENHLSVRGEGNLYDEDIRQIHVTSPQLQLAMQGPTLRYLDRQATYTVHLANPGTATARNVELVTYLPKGMKYVTSDNQGQYDSQSHAVYWSLEELPADKQGEVHFTILPIEPGTHKLKTDGRAELGLKQVCEHEITVEGLAELAFSVSDVADPIEVGSDTAYEIRVQNKGSKPDTDIQLLAELPEGVIPSTGDGPTAGTIEGQRVVFAPLARLGPNEEAVFKIHARGAVIGDHVIRVQVRSAELRVPVTKEEITRVYSDK